MFTRAETCCQLCTNVYICAVFHWINYFIHFLSLMCVRVANFFGSALPRQQSNCYLLWFTQNFLVNVSILHKCTYIIILYMMPWCNICLRLAFFPFPNEPSFLNSCYLSVLPIISLLAWHIRYIFGFVVGRARKKCLISFAHWLRCGHWTHAQNTAKISTY
jgi:hypothetical protein